VPSIIINFIKRLVMKKAILITLFIAGSVTFALGQCAVYVCPYTGAWGGMYNDGEYPVLSMQKLQSEAERICTENGGEECEFFYSSECSDCYWAFIMGDDGEGNFNYMAYISYISEEDAAYQVRKAYREQGGLGPSTARVTTWYVPAQ
jgi:hypothetical protein